MLFISQAFAQAQDVAPVEPNSMASMIPLILIFMIFYFFVIRPQHKKIKEHNDMVSEIKKGDEILTGGGIVGKVNKVKDNILHVEIADGVEVRVEKHTISSNMTKEKKQDKN